MNAKAVEVLYEVDTAGQFRAEVTSAKQDEDFYVSSMTQLGGTDGDR